MSEYPSHEDLVKIINWDIKDPIGLLHHIDIIWSSYGFVEIKGKNILKIKMVTGGWSGNEDIIHALQQNLFWGLYWEKSVRGGLFEFKVDRRIR